MRAELARLLRIVADGREEYAEGSIPGSSRDLLHTEAAAFRSAANIVEGDTSGLWRLLPTWRLDTEVEQLAALCDRVTEPEVTDAMVDAAYKAMAASAQASLAAWFDGKRTDPRIAQFEHMRAAIKAAIAAQEAE